MNDMKEYWDLAENVEPEFRIKKRIEALREIQGLFFWKRGGKQFAYWFIQTIGWNGTLDYKYNNLVAEANYRIKISKEDDDFFDYRTSPYAQDFLDCVACLGKDKVKELIKKEGGFFVNEDFDSV